MHCFWTWGPVDRFRPADQFRRIRAVDGSLTLADCRGRVLRLTGIVESAAMPRGQLPGPGPWSGYRQQRQLAIVVLLVQAGRAFGQPPV